jgi:hypothetical protein
MLTVILSPKKGKNRKADPKPPKDDANWPEPATVSTIEVGEIC